MCQYLLNSGADTDYVASYAGCSEYAEGYMYVTHQDKYVV